MRRILAVPLVVALLLPGRPADRIRPRWSALAIFIIACFTDFWTAIWRAPGSRHRIIGRMLDPIADKLLVRHAC